MGVCVSRGVQAGVGGAGLGKHQVRAALLGAGGRGALTQPQQGPLHFSGMPMKLLMRKSILNAASNLGFHGDC